ncbi:MAG: Branched-chain amino acid aminotransferase [Labilithrix sp.]|nr:Branched-chain amino acid aminotransferase [Labilithrix sp.]
MAITAPLLWFDGTLVESRMATIPLMGHAPQRGSLVFDVGSFHRARGGVALFRAREHVARFVRSARIVGLALPFDEDALVRAAVDVVAACKRDDGLVRWSVYFAANEPDLLPRDGTTHVAVAAQLLEDPPRMKPIRIAVFDDARKASPSALSPEAKVAAAYLGPMLARRRAVAAGADDVVLLDDDGNIAEAPIANVFAVTNGTLRTPPLGRVLPGITRDAVLALALAEGIPVREEPLTRDAFVTADEAFLTSTSLPIAPIGTIDGRALGTAEAPGPMTSRLAARLAAAQHGEDDAFAAWLTPVAR